MAATDAWRLRELVNDYYHGLITPESYRQQRAELLDNIGKPTAGESEVTTPRKAQRAVQESAPQPVAAETAPGSRKPLVLVLGGVVIVAVAVAGVLFTRGPQPQEAPGTPPPALQAVEETSTNQARALLEDFLARNDWSDDSLANFASTWELLDAPLREGARTAPEFRRLTSSLNRRLVEEAALATPESARTLAALTQFAANMGIAYRETRAATGVAADMPGSEPAGGEAPVAAPDESGAGSQAAAPIEAAPTDPVTTATADDTVAAAVPAEAVAAPQGEPTPEEPQRDPAPDNRPAALPAEVAATEPATDAPTAADDPCPAAIAATRRPYCQDTLADGGNGPQLVVLPTGGFRMGSGRFETESPVHEVRIDKSFAMSRYEISVGEFDAFCRATGQACPGAAAGGEKYPVVNVSWDDAVRYTRWLSDASGFEYRLPTEAEWEFAVRGGTQSPYFFGDQVTPANAHSIANGRADSPLPQDDRTINRNPYRLFHMSGNVREWVQDTWFQNYENAPDDGSARDGGADGRRVVRGGSFVDPAPMLRSAAREPLDSAHRDAVTGFRIVREVLP